MGTACVTRKDNAVPDAFDGSTVCIVWEFQDCFTLCIDKTAGYGRIFCGIACTRIRVRTFQFYGISIDIAAVGDICAVGFSGVIYEIAEMLFSICVNEVLIVSGTVEISVVVSWKRGQSVSLQEALLKS